MIAQPTVVVRILVNGVAMMLLQALMVLTYVLAAPAAPFTSDVHMTQSTAPNIWAHTTAGASPGDQGVAPDDTGRNTRDRSGQTLTPMDQSNDPRDIELTRQIRQALTEDDSLSTAAKNIKIITINGKVTLRGPVENKKERSRIGETAKALAHSRVDNQLEVKSR